MGIQEKSFDVCIIGGGPAGIFSVTQAGILGMSSCLIESTSKLGGQCTHLYPEKYIYDIPGFERITATDLCINLQNQAKKFNPEYFLNESAQSIIKIEESEYNFKIKTNKRIIFAKAIIIAIGKGNFEPNKPDIKNLELYENKSVFYNVNNTDLFKDKKITIAGGGDSAADWAIQLSNQASNINLVHRRNVMKCLQSSFDKIQDLNNKSNHFNFLNPYQITELVGKNGYLKKVVLKNFKKNEYLSIDTDYLLLFFGIKSTVTFLDNWGLELTQDKKISVSNETMMTNIDGIYAIGDISAHAAKMKLILSFFSESCLALHNAYELIFKKKLIHMHSSSKKF